MNRSLPSYIYGREAAPGERVYTEAAVASLIARIEQLERLWMSAEERAGLGEVAALSHAERIVALEARYSGTQPAAD